MSSILILLSIAMAQNTHSSMADEEIQLETILSPLGVLIRPDTSTKEATLSGRDSTYVLY